MTSESPNVTTREGEIPDPQALRHDAEQIVALAALADAACDGVDDPHEAGFQALKLAKTTQPPVSEADAFALRDTFLYSIDVAPVDEQPNASLAPATGQSLPPALDTADAEIRQLWLALAGQVQHPVARARCWDLVFSLRLIKNRREAATHAIAAYVDTAASTLSRQNVANGLVRAWTMARLVGIADIDPIISAMKALAENAVARQEDPFAAATVLHALIAPPARRQAKIVDPSVAALLDKALSTYPQPHVIKSFADLIRKNAGAGSPIANAASRHEVGALLAEADTAADPMIIRTQYAYAASVAREYGLADLEQSRSRSCRRPPPRSGTRSASP